MGSEENLAGGQTALRVIVSGRVQGVGYRFFCQRKAQELGIGGWAKNCADGTVQIMAVGSSEAVKVFVVELKRGPSFGKVENVVTTVVSDATLSAGERESFRIQ